jgi:hypothetical protein
MTQNQFDQIGANTNYIPAGLNPIFQPFSGANLDQ